MLSQEAQRMGTRQNGKKGRSFRTPMAINRPPAGSTGGVSRSRTLTRVALGLAVAVVAAVQPAAATTVRMVCLVVDLEGDGLQLGDRHFGVQFDVDGDGLQERVQWTVEEQREGFLWLDANKDDAMQPGELLGRRLATPDGPSRQAGWRALADLDLESAGGDGDGQLTAADRAWSDLHLWIDYDHDGDPDRAELYRLEDWRIESFALDFAQGLKMDGGMNLETAWASVSVRPRSNGSTAKSASKVTEVHLPLLSAPTAAVGTPVPLA